MMPGTNDDSGSIHEDQFLAELIPQAADHLAELHARDFDIDDGQNRFLAWLASRTEEPTTSFDEQSGKAEQSASDKLGFAVSDTQLAHTRLSLSVGLRSFRFELNIGRSGGDSSPGSGDRQRTREILGRALRVSRTRGDQVPRLAALAPERRSDRIQELPQRSATPPNFWAALTARQQEEFRMLADERTFAAGARLMQEGETADYVIVILDGRTRISVRGRDGTERVVAHRGPGQLVGERAALRVNLRSATVVALDQVQALAMTSANFATFLTNHPDVLQLVEELVYERLGMAAEENVTAGENLQAHAPLVTDEPPQWAGQNCTTIFSDVVAFGSPTRSDEHRRIIRREVLDMTRASLRAVWDQCHREDRGDGLLVVAPPSIPTVQILEYLLIALPIALKRHNRIYAEGAQIQLRVALDVGPVTIDQLGVSGQVIINAARLLDAPAFKESMDNQHAPLGMIVSDFVYQSVVSEAGSLTDAASYTEIKLEDKKARLRAWTLPIKPAITGKASDDLARSLPNEDPADRL